MKKDKYMDQYLFPMDKFTQANTSKENVMVKEFKPDQMALSTTVNGKTTKHQVEDICI